MRHLHRRVRPEPREHALSLTRDANTGLVPARRNVAGSPQRDQPAVPGAVPASRRRTRSPIRPNRADSINAFRPGHRDRVRADAGRSASSARSTKDMAVEIRYVGTRGVDQWSELNYNERNLIENGFFDEFKLAVANLTANNARGRHPRAGRSPTSAPAPAPARCRSTSRT